MSNNRKEVLINLCRKVGYFLLERENGRPQSTLSGCQECITIQIYSGDTVNALRDLSGTEGGTHYRDVNVSYFLGFPICSMLVLTHLFLNLKCH